VHNTARHSYLEASNCEVSLEATNCEVSHWFLHSLSHFVNTQHAGKLQKGVIFFVCFYFFLSIALILPTLALYYYHKIEL